MMKLGYREVLLGALAALVLMLVRGTPFGDESIAKSVQPSGSPQPTLAAPRTIVAVGEIIPEGDTLSVAPQYSGVVKSVAVAAGQKVVKGQELYSLDDSIQRGDWESKRDSYELAALRLKQAELKLSEAVRLATQAKHLEGRFFSPDHVLKAEFEAKNAEAQVNIAQRESALAHTELSRARSVLEKYVVTAPVSGSILRNDLKPGEFVNSDCALRCVLIGKTDQLYVRAYIDEFNIEAVDIHKTAFAMLRTPSHSRFELELARIEPLASPKKVFTGEAGERIDTRTVQVLFKIVGSPQFAYVGQQVDVHLSRGK